MLHASMVGVWVGGRCRRGSVLMNGAMMISMILSHCRGRQHQRRREKRYVPLIKGHAGGLATLTVCIMPPCMW